MQVQFSTKKDRTMSNNEQDTFSAPEHEFNAGELREIGKEQSEQLNEARNESVESRSEREVEQARAEVERATQENEAKKTDANPEQTERRAYAAPKDTQGAYRKTMEEVERHLTPVQRGFSHFIHHPVVEKTSEIVGGTIARPNAILSGSIFAFLLTLGIYVIASKYGYPLSGAETIAAFAAGWLIGQLFDYFRVMITGKRY